LSSKNKDNTSAFLTSLTSVKDSWCIFDLTSRRSQLERTAHQSREGRDASQEARKNLTDQTRRLKKCLKEAEVLADKKSVDTITRQGRITIKSFQEEIDSLTRRCKNSDNAFLNLYQNLYELPDPATVLRPACDVIKEMNEEIQKLSTESNKLELTSAACGNDGSMEKLKLENDSLRSQLTELVDKKEKKEDSLKIAEREELEQLRNESEQHRKETLSTSERNELMDLRREVTEYEVEFRSLKNQDITIRKLEAKIIELQKYNEEELSIEIRKAREELAETEGRRATEALEREAVLERKLQSLELELKAQKAGREAAHAHLLEADDCAGEQEAAWAAQRRIIIDDAERLRESLYVVTKERDDARIQVSALQNNTTASNTSAIPSGFMNPADFLAERKAYEAEVNELSYTLTTFREQLLTKEEAFNDQLILSRSKIESLQQDRIELSSEISRLKIQISNSPSPSTIETMKRELRILKRLEYNASDEKDFDANPEVTSAEADDCDLETVLVSRLRKAESDLLRERREKMDAQNEIVTTQKEISTKESELNEAQKLISNLELDLQKAFETPEFTSPIQQQLLTEESDPNLLVTILDSSDTSGTLHIPPKERNSATEKQKDDHSVATIVMAQRDRLRARCDSLEAERDSFKRELQLQFQLSESLKLDNTKLYEKVRFLQNFARGSTPLTDKDIDLEALEERYEASVDPFRQFNRSERQRKLKEMSTMERMVFYSAKTVLANKQMRTALFIYVCGMHLLVFITTYHFAHDSCVIPDDHESLAHMHGGVPLDETNMT